MKQSLNPRLATAEAAPIINDELRALGARIFHDSHRSPNIITGLKSTFLPGYGQLRAVHELMAGQHTPEQLNQAFTNIGATAKPRIDFVNRAVPAAAGVGVSGLIGHAMGRNQGEHQGQQEMLGDLSNLPLMARLKYMMSPHRSLGQMTMPQPDDNY